MTEDANQGIKRLRVKDVMVREPITIDSEMTVKRTALTMDRAGRGCLLVTSQGKVVGIITERDLVRKALAKGATISKTKVKTLMSSPLVIVGPEATVEEAAKVMAQHGVRRLPVVDENGLAGLITVTDIAKSLAQELEYSDAVFNAMARVRGSPKGVYQ